MAEEREKSLLEDAFDAPDVPAIALVLQNSLHNMTRNVTESLLDSYKKENKELKEELSDLKCYISKVQNRFNYLIFEQPRYEMDDAKEFYEREAEER